MAVVLGAVKRLLLLIYNHSLFVSIKTLDIQLYVKQQSFAAFWEGREVFKL